MERAKITVGYPDGMTITVTVPEELAHQAQAVGVSIETYVEWLAQQALDHPPGRNKVHARPTGGRNLVDLFAPVRGLLTDQEVDVLFARNPSTSRPLDL